MLTPEEINEFRQIAKESMNVDLTYEEAEEQGRRLIMLIEAMAKGSSPVPLSG